MSHIETREVHDPVLNIQRDIRWVSNPKPVGYAFPNIETDDLEDFEEWYLTHIDAVRSELGYGPDEEFNNNINNYIETTVADKEFSDFVEMLKLTVATYNDAYNELSTYGSSADVGGISLDAHGAKEIVETISSIVKHMFEYLAVNDNLVVDLMKLYYSHALSRDEVLENSEIPDEIKNPYVIAVTVFLKAMDLYFLSLGFDHYRILPVQLRAILTSIHSEKKE